MGTRHYGGAGWALACEQSASGMLVHTPAPAPPSALFPPPWATLETMFLAVVRCLVGRFFGSLGVAFGGQPHVRACVNPPLKRTRQW